MGIRDVVLSIIVAGGIPFMLRSPWVGVMYWVWFGLMNPQLMTYGFAQRFPFAALIAATTLVGLVVSSDRIRLKPRPQTIILLLLAAWMTMTTFFALNPAGAWPAWERAMKVLLMTFVAIFVLNDKKRLEIFVAMMALSVGYFGVKGGLFTLRTGGAYMVYASGGFLSENNATGLAILMAIPLIWYFFVQTTTRWLKWALGISAVLSAAAVLGTQSRGAFLAICAIGLFLVLKSNRRVPLTLALLLVGVVLVLSMPASWTERMQTIETYQQDNSAMGRINAWKMVTHLASDRPLMGGGFECYTPEIYARYGGGFAAVLAAHSIYFQMLGEHGWIALLMFLALWFFTWRDASFVIRTCRDRADLKWATNLAAMLQVSLIGYLVGGAFLSLANWDMPYYLLVAVVVLRDIVSRAISETPAHAIVGASSRLMAKPAYAAGDADLRRHAPGSRLRDTAAP